jgi:putative endonuclease
LVYYEIHTDVYEAITREKRIKKHVPTKVGMEPAMENKPDEQNNPQWLDIGSQLF